MDVIVVIPAYNEATRIAPVIKKTLTAGYTVVVVNDGSKDQTATVAERSGANVLSHIINLGKGAAAKTGCEWALRQGAKRIVLMDADGQHKPEDVKRLLAKLDEGNDVVLGYRKLDKHMPSVMRLGNWVINTASSILNGITIKDTQSGFRTMSAQAYRKIRWESSDYGMESEMIARIARKRLRYAQIPIQTIYYDNFKGTTVSDGIKILLRLLKWRLMA